MHGAAHRSGAEGAGPAPGREWSSPLAAREWEGGWAERPDLIARRMEAWILKPDESLQRHLGRAESALDWPHSVPRFAILLSANRELYSKSFGIVVIIRPRVGLGLSIFPSLVPRLCHHRPSFAICQVELVLEFCHLASEEGL